MAGELKGRYKIPIADALIAASAFSEGALVISDDPDYKKIPRIVALNEKECLERLTAGSAGEIGT